MEMCYPVGLEQFEGGESNGDISFKLRARHYGVSRDLGAKRLSDRWIQPFKVVYPLPEHPTSVLSGSCRRCRRDARAREDAPARGAAAVLPPHRRIQRAHVIHRAPSASTCMPHMGMCILGSLMSMACTMCACVQVPRRPRGCAPPHPRPPPA